MITLPKEMWTYIATKLEKPSNFSESCRLFRQIQVEINKENPKLSRLITSKLFHYVEDTKQRASKGIEDKLARVKKLCDDLHYLLSPKESSYLPSIEFKGIGTIYSTNLFKDKEAFIQQVKGSYKSSELPNHPFEIVGDDVNPATKQITEGWVDIYLNDKVSRGNNDPMVPVKPHCRLEQFKMLNVLLRIGLEIQWTRSQNTKVYPNVLSDILSLVLDKVDANDYQSYLLILKNAEQYFQQKYNRLKPNLSNAKMLGVFANEIFFGKGVKYCNNIIKNKNFIADYTILLKYCVDTVKLLSEHFNSKIQLAQFNTTLK